MLLAHLISHQRHSERCGPWLSELAALDSVSNAKECVLITPLLEILVIAISGLQEHVHVTVQASTVG